MCVARRVFTRSLLSFKSLYETVKRRRHSAQGKAESDENGMGGKVGAADRSIGRALQLKVADDSAQLFIAGGGKAVTLASGRDAHPDACQTLVHDSSCFKSK